MSLREDFGHLFSKSAFGRYSGDEALLGKFGHIVEMEDGTWDFLIGFSDGRPMGERRIANLAEKLPEQATLRRLNGEAYGRVAGMGSVIKLARVLGVKKKRRVTPAMEENLRRMRAAQG